MVKLKRFIVIALSVTLLYGCGKVERKQYGTICGVPIYSPSTNNLIVEVQGELLNGGHPIGAYEEDGKVVFIYEEQK